MFPEHLFFVHFFFFFFEWFALMILCITTCSFVLDCFVVSHVFIIVKSIAWFEVILKHILYNYASLLPRLFIYKQTVVVAVVVVFVAAASSAVDA